jgi:Ca2+-binding RTX toxin-like protein
MTRHHSNKLRRGARRVRPSLAVCEDRVLPATSIYLDFDGASQTEVQLAMDQFRWEPPADHDELGFVIEFAALQAGGYGDPAIYAFLDFDVNGTLDRRDGELAADRIMERVREDYAPYDVRIVRVDVTRSALRRMARSDTHDALIFVTGVHEVESVGGVATYDLGNEFDDMGFASGSVGLARWLVNNGFSGAMATDAFVNMTANFISHEAAHTFGMAHINMKLQPNAVSLGTPAQGWTNVGFTDIGYMTDEGLVQNLHQYLTETLDASPRPWAAVLQPGVLTIRGSESADIASVVLDTAGDWTVSLLGPRVRETYHVDPSNSPDLPSLNPFTLSVTEVRFNGGGRGDFLNVDPGIGARLEAFGEGGNDTLRGGGGSDRLDGGAGRDTLEGRDGLDVLSGGDHSDDLDGGTGDDALFGGDGSDVLRGGEQDFLDGGEWSDMYELQFADSIERGNLVANVYDSGSIGADALVALGTELADEVTVADDRLVRFIGWTFGGYGHEYYFLPAYHTVVHQGMEDLRLRTLDDSDEIDVLGALSATPVVIQTGDGDDTVTTHVGGIRGPVEILGGSDGDTLIIDDAEDQTPDQVTLTATWAGGGNGDNFLEPGARLDYLNIERVELNMGNGPSGDTILVAPSRSTEFHIRGNDPTSGSDGDLLEILLAGARGATFLPGDAVGTGTWIFINRSPISFEGIELMVPEG